MTTQEHHNFCKDLSAVMRKHGVVGMAGYWFGKPGNGSGVATIYPSDDFELRQLTQILSEEMRKRMEALIPGVKPITTTGFHPNEGEKT